MPSGWATYPQNLVLAASTGGGEVLPVAVLTVQLAFLLHEPVLRQGGVAVGTGEFLRVPGQTHGNQEGAPGGRGRRTDFQFQGVEEKIQLDIFSRCFLIRPF